MKKSLILILWFVMLCSFLSIGVVADLEYDTSFAGLVSEDGITTTFNLDLLDDLVLTQTQTQQQSFAPVMMLDVTNQLLLDDAFSFKIKGIDFLNSMGENTDSLSDSGKINTITIEKNTQESISANIIVSLYNNMKLDGVKIVNIPSTINQAQDYTYDLNIDLPTDISNYTVKAYVWEGVSTLKPYSKIYNTDINSKVSVGVLNGQQIILKITGTNIQTFVDKIFTVSYDENAVELIDVFSDNDINVGEVAGGNITIVENSPGILKFSVSETILPNQMWSGVLNIIKFVGTTDISSIISVSASQ